MLYRSRFAVTTVMLLVVGSLTSSASALLFVSTGQTGAQVQTDVNHTKYWTYTVSADVTDVDGALFTMKKGSATTEDITFSIIEGTFGDYGSATPLFERTLTPASFTQSFDGVMFQDTPITLAAGTTYTGVLSSLANDPQSEAYFIKQALLSFVDGNGDPVTPSGGGEIVSGDSNIPEPATLALFAVAGMMLPLRRRQR